MKSFRRLTLCICLIGFISCESFLEVDPPETKIVADLVFEDDNGAISAITGVYLEMYRTGFANGGPESIVLLAGLSSDELLAKAGDPELLQVGENALMADNAYVLSLWSSLFTTVYQANAILEGLDKSSTVTQTVEQQVRGEALFIRAFCHFYLVNCFGDVPIILTTDYTLNARVTRKPVEQVYDQILADLIEAENLLTDDYPVSKRIRPNKSTATALLARVYLYKGDWQRAEDKASNVISKTSIYYLPNNLNNVFLSSSPEAIWQLRVPDNVEFNSEAYNFSEAITKSVLRSDVTDLFEVGDKRRNDWIKTITSPDTTIYLPFKYKAYALTGVEANEYLTIFRLAEQHLIRAEARMRQDKLVGANSASSDINIIRFRAGLLPTTASTEDEIESAIEKERRLEYLVEWGHRWFDLKRWGKTESVLLPLKPGWSENDQLYPIPAKELRANPNLNPQNTGY